MLHVCVFCESAIFPSKCATFPYTIPLFTTLPLPSTTNSSAIVRVCVCVCGGCLGVRRFFSAKGHFWNLGMWERCVSVSFPHLTFPLLSSFTTNPAMVTHFQHSHPSTLPRPSFLLMHLHVPHCDVNVLRTCQSDTTHPTREHKLPGRRKMIEWRGELPSFSSGRRDPILVTQSGTSSASNDNFRVTSQSTPDVTMVVRAQLWRGRQIRGVFVILVSFPCTHTRFTPKV